MTASPAAFADAQATEPLRQLMDVDFATQLPDDLLLLTDKMSMAVSLECRVPLLDQRLVELAARMPGPLKVRGGELKHVMKRALAGVLPDSILHREKRGFGAPMGAWLRAELAPMLRDVLSRESVIAPWPARSGCRRAHDPRARAAAGRPHRSPAGADQSRDLVPALPRRAECRGRGRPTCSRRLRHEESCSSVTGCRSRPSAAARSGRSTSSGTCTSRGTR